MRARSEPKESRRGSFVASLATLLAAEALLLAPVLADLLSGPRRVFSYLAADAFYYLTVARNWADYGSLSFDRQHETNGFHPLWQAMLGGLFAARGAFLATDEEMLWATTLLCLGLVAVAVWLLGGVMKSAKGRLSPLYALVPLGLYGLLLSPLWEVAGEELPRLNPFEGSAPLWGTLWFSVNGMETGVLLASYAAMAFLFVRKPVLRDARWAAAFGLAMGLTVLSRLDHVFFPAALGIGLVLLALRQEDRASLRNLVITGVVGAFVVLVYLVWSKARFGSFVPISGRLKSSFPYAQTENLKTLYTFLVEPLPRWWLERVTRLTHMLVPAVFAIAELALGSSFARAKVRSPGPWRLDFLLKTGCVAILILATYNLLYVRAGDQGHWYFPLSTLMVTLLVIRWLERRTRLTEHLEGAGLWAVTLLLIAAVSAGAFLRWHRHEDHHERFADFFFDVAPQIRSQYAGDPPSIVELDDGIVTFSTNFPGMTTSGLTLDERAIQALMDGRLMEFAVERGHDRFASSIFRDRFLRWRIRGLEQKYFLRREFHDREHDMAVWRVIPRRPTLPRGWPRPRSGSRSGSRPGPRPDSH